jgi:hypothetical protein
MRQRALLWVAGAILSLTGQVQAEGESTSELRDPAVLYFDQTLPEPFEAKLLQATDVFSGKDLSLRLATLPAGYKVKLVGLDQDLCLIQTQYQSNTVYGWIELKNIPPLDPQMVDAARKNQAFRDAVTQAIKDRKVIEGMTLNDVQQSLGRPTRTSFRKEEKGRIDTWSYITYENIPQYTYGRNALGQIVQLVTYVKVPVGETTIEFSDGRVTAIEQHKSNRRERTGGVALP